MGSSIKGVDFNASGRQLCQSLEVEEEDFGGHCLTAQDCYFEGLTLNGVAGRGFAEGFAVRIYTRSLILYCTENDFESASFVATLLWEPLLNNRLSYLTMYGLLHFANADPEIILRWKSKEAQDQRLIKLIQESGLAMIQGRGIK